MSRTFAKSSPSTASQTAQADTPLDSAMLLPGTSFAGTIDPTIILDEAAEGDLLAVHSSPVQNDGSQPLQKRLAWRDLLALKHARERRS